MNAKRYESFYALIKGQRKENVALLYEEEGAIRSLTYDELAQKIEGYPLREESCIGILAENNLETIVSIFAYAKAKRQIVLLNPLDDIALLKKQIVSADVSALVGREELKEALKDSLVDKKVPNNGNILFFTSGTTSSGKAVVLSEESLCASAYNGGSLLPLEESDTLLSILPLSHVFGFVCSLLWGLSFGAKVALGRGMRHMMDDPRYFKATVISMVPLLSSFLALNKLWNPELRLVLIGAGPIKKEIIDIYKSSGIKVSFGYGLSETSSGVALSIGEDPFAMKICPDDTIKIGEDGEILIHAPTCLMKGYYKSDDRSYLLDDYLLSGDLGYIDEKGLLHITGRKKDILVLNDGTKIYCPEYEESLRKLLPGADLAVALKDDKLTLFIYEEKMTPNLEDIVNEFNLSHPRGARVAKIEYLKSKLPRTQTGKVKRYALLGEKQ